MIKAWHRLESSRALRSEAKHPSADTSENFCSRFRVEARRRSKPKVVPTEPPFVTRLLAKAERWQADLDAGRVKNRAELARREETSTGRASQVLNLLRLEPEIQEWIRGLPPGTPARYVAERQLREIARMPPAEQIEAVRRRWGPGAVPCSGR